jgi:hypothetical protein
MPFLDQLIINRRKPNHERRVIFIIKKKKLNAIAKGGHSLRDIRV